MYCWGTWVVAPVADRLLHPSTCTQCRTGEVWPASISAPTKGCVSDRRTSFSSWSTC